MTAKTFKKTWTLLAFFSFVLLNKKNQTVFSKPP